MTDEKKTDAHSAPKKVDNELTDEELGDVAGGGLAFNTADGGLISSGNRFATVGSALNTADGGLNLNTADGGLNFNTADGIKGADQLRKR